MPMSRRAIKLIDAVFKDIQRWLSFSASQSSLRVLSFGIGAVSGILLTILVFKYVQIEELIQQTTRPMTALYDISNAPIIREPLNLQDHVKIFCIVLTQPINHQSKAKAVQETWGKRCNKLVFISSETEDFLDIIQVNVTEDRRFLWGKTRQGFQKIWELYGNEYDWFLKADDDTWIFMENLRYLLYSYSPEYPIYFGCKLKPYVQQGYMSGSGYVLSREAVRRFNEEAVVDGYKCWNGTEGNEDVEMGKCLSAVGVLAGDSRDDLERSRFLPFPPDGLLRNLFGETWLDNATFYEIKTVIYKI